MLAAIVARKCRRSLQRAGCEWQALLAHGGVNIPRTFSLKQSYLHWISFLWCNKLKVTFCTYYMLLFLKIRNRLLILVHSKFILREYFGSVAKRCGRDNSIYHPLGIFLRLFSLSCYILYRVQKISEFNSNTAIINQYNYHIMLL